MPRDSLAEIMAADQVIAAKNHVTSVASLSARTTSFESSRSLNQGELIFLHRCKSFNPL